MIVRKERCTEHCKGVVKEIRVKSNDITLIFVTYWVNGQEYELQESLKYTGEAIKIGFLPVGQRRRPVIGLKEIGESIDVSYNPNNPEEAFVTDNVGIWTA